MDIDFCLIQWFLTFFTYLTPFYHTILIIRFTSNALKWCPFLKNMKLTNSYSLESFVKIYIDYNLWYSKFIPLEGEIYPQG